MALLKCLTAGICWHLARAEEQLNTCWFQDEKKNQDFRDALITSELQASSAHVCCFSNICMITSVILTPCELIYLFFICAAVVVHQSEFLLTDTYMFWCTRRWANTRISMRTSLLLHKYSCVHLQCTNNIFMYTFLLANICALLMQ